MENLIEAIRNALASDASDEARAIGAQACRTILVALETPAGQDLNPASVLPTAQPTSQLQAVVSVLRGMSPDQLLDLAITRLKAALPPGSEMPQVQRLSVPLVQVPRLGGGS